MEAEKQLKGRHWWGTLELPTEKEMKEAIGGTKNVAARPPWRFDPLIWSNRTICGSDEIVDDHKSHRGARDETGIVIFEFVMLKRLAMVSLIQTVSI